MKARMLLVAVVLVGSAKAQHFQQYFQSASHYSSGPISASSVNGVLHISVDGRPIDLKQARLVSEDAKVKILQPVEVPEARILLPKTRNAFILKYRGYHFESIDNGRIFNSWSSV